jgi:HD-GYP domain-containing protein (c-di-GMP phosphodiesterase class II)
MPPNAVTQPQSLPPLNGAAAIYDYDTAEHSLRVAHTSVSIAGLLNLSEQEILTVWWAAMFHDVGKLTAPVEVLRKMGPLDEAEWQELRAHPAVGGHMLLAVSPVLAPIAAAIRAHHERWDGSGYPDGLKGDQIPLLGRIIAVASAFDSMTRPRPFRRGAVDVPEAIAELRRWSGHKFDPRIVRLVVKLHHHGRVADANTVLRNVQHLPEAVRFPQLSALSARQWEVLSHLMRGERVRTIANELFISQTTVRNHLSAIFELFGVHSQAELVALLSGDDDDDDDDEVITT